MNTIKERFLETITKNYIQFIALIAYISFIISYFYTNISLPLQLITYIIIIYLEVFYIKNFYEKVYDNLEIINQKIVQKIKQIAKEIILFIPILFISNFATFYIMKGLPENQKNLNEIFIKSPITCSILAIIFAPILEELICRFLPLIFIKKKYLYIFISTIVFSLLHVINDPKPYYYIWFYMIEPLYWGYRYYKTRNILVPITLHSLSNLICVLIILFYN